MSWSTVRGALALFLPWNAKKFQDALKASMLASGVDTEYRNAVGRDQQLLQKHHRSLLVVNELMQAAPEPLLSKMQAFALREGFSHMTAAFTSGSEPSPWQGEKDPLGVLLALPMSHPVSTLTWSDYRIACGSIARCLDAMSQKRKVLSEELQPGTFTVMATSPKQSSAKGLPPIIPSQCFRLEDALQESVVEELLHLCDERRELARGLTQTLALRQVKDQVQSLSVGQDDLAHFHQRIELECSSMQGWLMELLAWHAAHKLMARQQLSKVRLTEVELKLKLELGEETYRNSQWLSMMKQASNLLNRAKAGEILHEREWVDLETDLTNLLSQVWPTRCISAKVTSRLSAFIQEIKASIE